jgi:hypothetical protein
MHHKRQSKYIDDPLEGTLEQPIAAPIPVPILGPPHALRKREIFIHC